MQTQQCSILIVLADRKLADKLERQLGVAFSWAPPYAWGKVLPIWFQMVDAIQNEPLAVAVVAGGGPKSAYNITKCLTGLRPDLPIFLFTESPADLEPIADAFEGVEIFNAGTDVLPVGPIIDAIRRVVPAQLVKATDFYK